MDESSVFLELWLALTFSCISCHSPRPFYRNPVVGILSGMLTIAAVTPVPLNPHADASSSNVNGSVASKISQLRINRKVECPSHIRPLSQCGRVVLAVRLNQSFLLPLPVFPSPDPIWPLRPMQWRPLTLLLLLSSHTSAESELKVCKSR